MAQVKISDIHAGKPDAKEDISRSKREFMNTYLIPPNLNVDSLITGDVCYIVGNKGLGKTAALRYLNQCFWDDNHATISTFLLFERDYSHQVKSRMETVAVSQSYITYQVDKEPDDQVDKLDFSLVWRWHLFLSIVRDNKDGKIFFKDGNWKRFERFVTGIFKKELQATVSVGVDLKLPENIPSLLNFIQPHISIEIPEFNIGRREYTFSEAMENAEEWFLKLKDSRGVTPYYIFVDELDIHYGNEKSYLRDLRLVHDLALEVKRFNDIIHKQGWHKNTKVFCTLRPEVIQAIEERLPARSLKREMEGYRFDLKWSSDSSETYSLPIIKLLLKRIEVAENEKGVTTWSDMERYKRWFPDQIEGMEPSDYIRQITWSRPRDIVRLLNVAKRQRPNDTAFTKYVFEDLMRDYSKGSKEEIRGELETSYPPSEIEDIFECFVLLPERFTLKEFRERLEENGWKEEPGHDAASVLGDLYRIGAIGQVVGDQVMWFYQGELYSRRLVNVVHRGLVQALKVVQEKKNTGIEEGKADQIICWEGERKKEDEEEKRRREAEERKRQEAEEKRRQEIEKKRRQEEENRRRRKKRKNAILIITAIVITVCLVVFFLYFKNQMDENETDPTEEGYIAGTETLVDQNVSTGSDTEQTSTDEEEYVNPLSALKKAKAGDEVIFGTYEKDNDLSNGNEEIEWLVLEKKDDRMLLLSKYALDVQQYNNQFEDVTWETCTLRRWLNQDFLKTAFTEEEQKWIPAVEISNSDNEKFGTEGGRDTNDQVFLLSLNEAKMYFENDDDRICQPTEYALAKNKKIKHEDIGTGCWWWLRSPGDFSYNAANVWQGGSLAGGGLNVDSGSVTVRPALWLNLSS